MKKKVRQRETQGGKKVESQATKVIVRGHVGLVVGMKHGIPVTCLERKVTKNRELHKTTQVMPSKGE